MVMAAGNDPFGLTALGFDPYHQQKADKLARYSQIDSLLAPQGQTPAAMGGTMYPRGSRAGTDMPGAPAPGALTNVMPGGMPRLNPTDLGSPDLSIGPIARSMMMRGRGGSYMPGPGGQMELPGDMFNSGGNPGAMNNALGGVCTADDKPDCPSDMRLLCTDGEWSCEPFETPEERCKPGTEPECPENSEPFCAGNGWICRPSGFSPEPGDPGEDPRGPGGGFPYNSSNIPPDIAILRQKLGRWLEGNFGNMPSPYPGNLNVGRSPYMDQAAQIAGMMGGGLGYLGMGEGALKSLLGGGSSMESLYPSLGRLLGGEQGGGDWFGGFRQMQPYAQGMNPFLQMMINGDPSVMGGRDASGSLFSEGAGLTRFGAPQAEITAASISNPGRQQLLDIAGNGGMPDITSALANIRQQGMQDIADLNAQNREQYGAMGLGASSDVNEALARGSSRGVSDILARQESLIASLYPQATQARLGAASTLGSLGVGMGDLVSRAYGSAGQGLAGIGAGMGDITQRGVEAGMASRFGAMDRYAGTGRDLAAQLNLGTAGQYGAQNDALNRMLQSLGMGREILSSGDQARLGAISQLPGFAQTGFGGGAQQAQILAQLAAMDQGLSSGNIDRGYQDWIRQQYPTYLDPALSFATGFPPMQQKPVVSGGGGAGAMFAQMAPILMAMATSHPSFKENITHVSGESFADKMMRVPTYRWNYKGDSVPHHGPMAPDFAREFGGPEYGIYYQDAIGAIMATLHEIIPMIKGHEGVYHRA